MGARGFSSTGTSAQNFTKGALAIGGASATAWVFANTEADATYMILTQVSTPPSVLLRSIVKTTTQVMFNFAAQVPSGITMDIVLLR